MRLVVVWNEQTDYAREVREWIHEYERRGSTVMPEILDPETIEGEMFTTAHDIVRYPAVVALTDDGKVLEKWLGTPMPQLDAVAYWANS